MISAQEKQRSQAENHWQKRVENENKAIGWPCKADI